MNRYRWKRFLTWLAAVMMAVSVLAGCGGAMGVGNAGSKTRAEIPTLSGAPQTEADAVSGQTLEQEQTQEWSSESERERSSESEQSSEPEAAAESGAPEASQDVLDEHGSYTGKDQVALFLWTYGRLPDNYITKKQAQELGWDSSKGNLWDVAPGKSIGGSRFGNYEKHLPEKQGRTYYECDLDYEGGRRGAKRLVYSNDGLIFYTEDHYETFEQLEAENEKDNTGF